MPTFISASSAANSNGSNPLTIAAPAGVAQGNLLIAVVGANSGSPSPAATGWNLQGTYNAANGDTGAYWTRTAGPSEPTAYVWTGGNWLAGAILQYANAVVDGAAVWADVNSTPVTIPSATPTTAADIRVAVVYTTDGSGIGLPTGMTFLTGATQSGLDGIAAFQVPLASSAATGSLTTTLSPNDSAVGFTLLLKSNSDVIFGCGRDSTNTHTVIGSADGVNWHFVANPNDSRSTGSSSAYGIATDGAGNYVLGGLGSSGSPGTGTISYSTNGGMTFTAVTSPFDSPATTGGQGAAYEAQWAPELGLWLMAGSSWDSSITIATSPDMINWTTRHNPLDGSFCGQIGWNGSLAVAVGSNGDSSITIATSPDGINWTARPCPFDGDFAQGVWWDGTVWLATGETVTAPHTCIITSPDGINWTGRPSPFDGPTDSGSGNFIVGDGAGTLVANAYPKVRPGPIICTSTDHGVTWTPQVTPFDPTTASPNFSTQSATWSSGLRLWIMAGTKTGTTTAVVATSPDAVTWTLRSTPFDGGSFGYPGLMLPPVMGGTSFAPPQQLLAFGTDGHGGQKLLEKYSPATGTWTQVVTPWDTTPDWNFTSYVKSGIYVDTLGMYFLGGLSGDALASGANFDTLMSSPDGANWTTVPNPLKNGDNAYLTTLVWDGAQLVAGGWATNSTDPVIMTSPDGTTWTARSSPLDGGSIDDMAYNGSVWLAVGRDASNNGVALTSSNGHTWTVTGMFGTFANTLSSSTVCWFPAGNLWISGNNQSGSCIFTSGPTLTSDGSNWSAQNGFLTYCNQIRLLNGTLFATGAYYSSLGYTLSTSTDGLTWTSVFVGGGNGDSVFWDGVTYWQGDVQSMYKSPNGTAWTQSPGVLDTGQVFGFVQGPVGSGAATPPPTVIPNYRGTPGIIPIRDVAVSPPPSYNGTLFVSGAGLAKYDATGSWTTVSTPWDASSPPGSWMYCGVWAGPPINKYFIGGSTNFSGFPVMMSSTDGNLWINVTTPWDGDVTTSAWIGTIVWNGTILVAVGGSADTTTGTSILSSTDGVTWTTRTSVMGPGGGAYDVAWSGSNFLAVGTDASNNAAAAISADGVTWTTVTLPWTTITPNSVAWHSPTNLWVIAGNNNHVIISPDAPGLNWTIEALPLNSGVNVRAFGDTAIASGVTLFTDEPIATSQNTFGWTAQITPDAPGIIGQYNHFDGATWWAGVANGPDGNLLTSSDTTVWVPQVSPNSNSGPIYGIWSHGTPPPPPPPTPPPVITFISTNGNLNPSTTSGILVDGPSSVVAGNLLVALVGLSGGAGITAPDVSWTSIGGGGSGDTIQAYTKLAGSGDVGTGATYFWSFTGSPTSVAVIMLQFSNTTGKDASDIVVTNFTASSTATAIGCTPTGPNDYIITAFYDHGTFFNAPSGQTLLLGNALSTVSFSAFGQLWTSSSPTGNMTAGLETAPNSGAALTLLLAPAGSSPPPPSGPAFVSASTVDESSLAGANSVTVSAPSGLVNANTLIAVVVAENTTITAPSGWNYLGNVGGFYSFSHVVVGGSEPGSYTFNFAASASGWAGTILQYSGVNHMIAMNQAPLGASTTSASVNTGTSTAANAVALAVFYSEGSSYSTPSGFTQRAQGSGTATRMAAFDEALPTSGTSPGTVTTTLSPASSYFAVSLILQP